MLTLEMGWSLNKTYKTLGGKFSTLSLLDIVGVIRSF